MWFVEFRAGFVGGARRQVQTKRKWNKQRTYIPTLCLCMYICTDQAPHYLQFSWMSEENSNSARETKTQPEKTKSTPWAKIQSCAIKGYKRKQKCNGGNQHTTQGNRQTHASKWNATRETKIPHLEINTTLQKQIYKNTMLQNIRPEKRGLYRQSGPCHGLPRVGYRAWGI